MSRHETDALIIGTGFGAAAPALRLAQAGVKVTLLEKGPRIDLHTHFVPGIDENKAPGNRLRGVWSIKVN